MNQYDLKDLANELNISDRTARRYVDELINETQSIRSNKYKFSSIVFNSIVKSKQIIDTELTENDNGITEYFTENEYLEFQKRLTEYPILKDKIEESRERLNDSKEYIKTLLNELEYHKLTYQKHLEMHQKMIDVFQQRNYIEAKEKGLDQ